MSKQQVMAGILGAAVFVSCAGVTCAEAQIAMYTFRGNQPGYEGVCEGFIRQQLGWLDANGRPIPIPAAQQISVIEEIRSGPFVLDLRQVVAGFVSNPAGAPVPNARAYDLNRTGAIEAYTDAFTAAGGTWFNCTHSEGRFIGAALVKGGLIHLDDGSTFAGFRPIGTGVPDEEAYRPALAGRPAGDGQLPAPPGPITAHLHGCWTDRIGVHPESSVSASLAVILGAGRVTGHVDKSNATVAPTLAGSAAAVGAARAALLATATANGFGAAPSPIGAWIFSLDFARAANPAHQYDTVKAVIAAVPGGAGVSLTLKYDLPEDDLADPPDMGMGGGCRVPAKTYTVNSTADDEDGLGGDGFCDTGNAFRGFTGICTLRAALTESDMTPDLDLIVFDIPGTGVPTIRPEVITAKKGPLGTLNPVIIDGTTQRGGLVELDGSLTSSGSDPAPVGLDIVGAGSLVRGLVINRFAADGIRIRPSGGPEGVNIIRDNFIGTDPTGTIPLGNGGDGVHIVEMPDNIVELNVIAGNGMNGVHIEGTQTMTHATGNDIERNLVAMNAAAGVLVDSSARANGVVANSIVSNGSLGIELQSGGNDLQAAPVLTSVLSSGGTTSIQGQLAGPPNASFVVNFFGSGACDSSGAGEGEVFIGSIPLTLDGLGQASFTAILPSAVAALTTITATATGPSGTSEFSRCASPTGVPADTTPPVITVSASSTTLWPANGRSVPVVISGRMTDAGSGVDPATATFRVIDEYGLVQPSGSIQLQLDGSYSFTVHLQASRLGTDRDGRQYVVIVIVKDKSGNEGSASIAITVPHDQGKSVRGD